MKTFKGTFYERSAMTYNVVIVAAQLLFSLLILLPSPAMSIIDDNDDMSSNYGVDVSFPMHHPFDEFNLEKMSHENHKDSINRPLGDRNQFYHNYMQGCRDKYDGGNRHGQCDNHEQGRILMTLSQPRKMTVSNVLLFYVFFAFLCSTIIICERKQFFFNLEILFAIDK